jgi:hypothetical protein
LHFLFLVDNYIQHADHWREFLSLAPPGSWKAFVHCKDSWGCNNNGVFTDNPGFVQVPSTETFYCHDLVTAMRVLLDNALKSQATAATGGREKFIFVSDSTLPIKPFSWVSYQLLQDDSSDFCVFPSNQWASGNFRGTQRFLVKHHQWVTLNREHAQRFVDSWKPVQANGSWPIYIRDDPRKDHQNVAPSDFDYPQGSSRCSDEFAFMANIYGAVQTTGSLKTLKNFGGGGVLNMESHTMQGMCRTWTFWNQNWDPQATALAGQIHNDFGSRISCYPYCQYRPAVLEHLTDDALHALRHSPFLFARKFSGVLYMGNYFDIVLK